MRLTAVARVLEHAQRARVDRLGVRLRERPVLPVPLAGRHEGVHQHVDARCHVIGQRRGLGLRLEQAQDLEAGLFP